MLCRRRQKDPREAPSSELVTRYVQVESDCRAPLTKQQVRNGATVPKRAYSSMRPGVKRLRDLSWSNATSRDGQLSVHLPIHHSELRVWCLLAALKHTYKFEQTNSASRTLRVGVARLDRSKVNMSVQKDSTCICANLDGISEQCPSAMRLKRRDHRYLDVIFG